MDGAILDGVILNHADLSADNPSDDSTRAYMSGAHISVADLSGTNFLGAQLSGTDLSGTKLVNAHLNNAFLFGANLSGANLSGADLSGAYLIAANLDVTQVKVAKNWKQAHYNRDFSQKLGLLPKKSGEVRNTEKLNYVFIVNKATGQCLGPKDNADNDVTPIVVSECTQSNPNEPSPPHSPNPIDRPPLPNPQLWRYLDDGHLLNQNGKCLGTMNGDTEKDTQLILFNCIDDHHQDQKWKYDEHKKVFYDNNKGYYMTTSSQNNVIEVVLDDSQGRKNKNEQMWDFQSPNDLSLRFRIWNKIMTAYEICQRFLQFR